MRLILVLRASRVFTVLRRCKHSGPADASFVDDQRATASKGPRYWWWMVFLPVQSSSILRYEMLPSGKKIS